MLSRELAVVDRIASVAGLGRGRQALHAVATEEAARLVGADETLLVGLLDGGAATVLARWAQGGAGEAPQAAFAQDEMTRDIAATREPREADAAPDGLPCSLGGGAVTGVPVPGSGEPWGVLYAAGGGEGMRSPATRSQLQLAAHLLAMAIAAEDARAAVEDAVARQAAIGRIVEAAALRDDQRELFAALCREASGAAGDAPTTLVRFDEGAVVVVGSAGGPSGVGDRLVPSRDGVIVRMRRTGRPAHAEAAGASGDAGCDLGIPILAGGRVWGGLCLMTGGHAGAGVEGRVAALAALVAPIVASAQAAAAVERAAQDHAALRRVAELVARGVPPERLFDAVAREASELLDGEATSLLRFEEAGGATVVATRGGPAPAGTLIPIAPGDDTTPARVLRTGRPARTDQYAGSARPDYVRRLGIGSSVAAPILVEHGVWGMLGVTTTSDPLPAAAERRLVQFAELVAVAIANAQSRAELTASRARVVAAADESRRRVQRDVHDGAQQRLVQVITTLKLAMEAMDGRPAPGADLVREALEQAELAAADMRDLVRGILPATLTRGGIHAGLETLVDKLPLEVELDVTTARLPPAIETTAYLIVAEALTNVVRHSGSDRATVRAAVVHDMLRVEVSDEGAGGAEPGRGTGLTGLFDRVAAGEGTLHIDSPPGAGTRIVARLPLPAVPSAG